MPPPFTQAIGVNMLEQTTTYSQSFAIALVGNAGTNPASAVVKTPEFFPSSMIGAGVGVIVAVGVTVGVAGLGVIVGVAVIVAVGVALAVAVGVGPTGVDVA